MVTFIFITIIIINVIDNKILELIKISFIILLITIISELEITIIMLSCTKISLNDISTNYMIKFIVNILIYINAIFIINSREVITKLFKTKKEVIINSAIINIIFFIGMTIMLLFNYSLINQHFNEYFNKKIFGVLIIVICSLVIAKIFLIINYTLNKQIRMMQIKEKEYDRLKLYSEITESLVDDIAKFKHDYNNIIFMMNGYIENNDFDGLRKHFSKEIFNQHNIYDYFKLKKIKEPGFKGLLAAKMSQIVKDGINISLEILNDIEVLYVDTFDLCRIIGILLDNAREAVKKCDEKIIAISIVQDGPLNITILNSYNDKVNINNIYQKGYSSKGENRGIGLSNVRNIINEKYPNVLLNTHIENHMFIQDLCIETKAK
ncbi:GHKL domain-containing protein [Clostridium sp. CF011]|uniref:sensor histidine kinase n=1 Tax=Clostridium sp. CF011 TaxID=2843318 RepID=UPI00227CB926|nr:GHKL domain-containing protein [Clostridium sp. CF011]WAG68397.1 GHKL domain-containing protein [Clostridium sp. CF011]